MNSEKNSLLPDISIVISSILIAIVLVKTHLLTKALISVQGLAILGSFISGIFFTSIFTTAPAIVTLGDIGKNEPILLVAFFGALGAVVGDLVIFRFVRDKLSDHLLELVSHRRASKRIMALFNMRIFRWLTFLLGGLIIASPLPDELGISFLGVVKTKVSLFIPISFIFNFIGIVLLCLATRALS